MTFFRVLPFIVYKKIFSFYVVLAHLKTRQSLLSKEIIGTSVVNLHLKFEQSLSALSFIMNRSEKKLGRLLSKQYLYFRLPHGVEI